MSTRLLRFTIFGASTLALPLAACHSTAPLRVVVHPTLAAGEVYEVRGLTNRYWGKPLAFGGFATRATKVGTTWEWTAGIFDLAAGQRVSPYRFVFVGEGSEEWHVECRTSTPILRHVSGRSEWEIELDETRLGCAMRDPHERVSALALAGNGLSFRGETEIGGERIEIRTLHQVPGRDGSPRRIPGVLGYELRQGGQVLGGVDLLGRGRVYLAQELPPELRNPVAMTATVLMFFGQA